MVGFHYYKTRYEDTVSVLHRDVLEVTLIAHHTLLGLMIARKVVLAEKILVYVGMEAGRRHVFKPRCVALPPPPLPQKTTKQQQQQQQL